MIVKKLFLIVLAISFFIVSGNAVERKKPLPLKELQNPNGPSYVPIPYPQTDEEVITNFKHFLNFRVIDKKQGEVSGISETASDLEKICFNYLNNKGIIVGEIVKVKNRMSSQEKDYSFLIRLKNENNYSIASFGMLANGIVGQWSYINLKDLSQNNPNLKEFVFKPLIDQSVVKKQIKALIGYNLDVEEIENINLVEGNSLIGDLTSPALEISLKNGRVLYKSYILRAIYELVETLDPNAKDYNSKKATIMRNSGFKYEYFDQNAVGEDLILRKIESEE